MYILGSFIEMLVNVGLQKIKMSAGIYHTSAAGNTVHGKSELNLNWILLTINRSNSLEIFIFKHSLGDGLLK